MNRKLKIAIGAFLLLAISVHFQNEEEGTRSKKRSSTLTVTATMPAVPDSGRVPAVMKSKQVIDDTPSPDSKEAAPPTDKLPSDLREFAELRQRVVRTASQKSAWERRLTDPSTRRAAVEQLDRSLSEEDRMTAVGYLLEGLSSADPAVQAEFTDSVEQAILTADLESGPASVRRERGADVGELAMGLATVSPSKVVALAEKTKGPKQVVIERALKQIDKMAREVARINEKK